MNQISEYRVWEMVFGFPLLYIRFELDKKDLSPDKTQNQKLNTCAEK